MSIFWQKKSNTVTIFDRPTNITNLQQLSSIDEPEHLNFKEMFQPSSSVISTDIEIVHRSILDIFDDLYSNRTHRRCIDFSFLTLLSMTLAIIFWIMYWLAWNRCQNSKDPQSNTSLCNAATLFEVFVFIFLIASPILLIIMIYSWFHYACYNPLGLIREKFVQLKLDGNQWQEQINSYNNQERTKCLRWFHRKQHTELSNRGYGYILLSPYGIVLDELVLICARKSIIHKVVLCHNKKQLRLTFRKTCARPWTMSLVIYLPENYIEEDYLEKLRTLLRIEFEQNIEHS